MSGARESAFKRLFLLQTISSLGSAIELNLSIDPELFQQEIEPFRSNWKRFADDPDVRREGLSLMSANGSFDLPLTLKPALKPTRPTPAFSALSSLRMVLDQFGPHLQDSQLVRFGRGGHIAPRRDLSGLETTSFLVLGLCANCERDQLICLLGDRWLTLETGKVYFFESRMEHSFFSFEDDCSLMFLNVTMNEASFATLMNHVRHGKPARPMRVEPRVDA